MNDLFFYPTQTDVLLHAQYFSMPCMSDTNFPYTVNPHCQYSEFECDGNKGVMFGVVLSSLQEILALLSWSQRFVSGGHGSAVLKYNYNHYIFDPVLTCICRSSDGALHYNSPRGVPCIHSGNDDDGLYFNAVNIWIEIVFGATVLKLDEGELW